MRVFLTVDTQAFAEMKQPGETNSMLMIFAFDGSGTGRSPLCGSQLDDEDRALLPVGGHQGVTANNVSRVVEGYDAGCAFRGSLRD